MSVCMCVSARRLFTLNRKARQTDSLVARAGGGCFLVVVVFYCIALQNECIFYCLWTILPTSEVEK